MLRWMFLLVFAPLLEAENWPSYRGPQGSGVSMKAAPVRWNADAATGPVKNILWRMPIPGLGHASPIIWGNRLFVASAVRTTGEAPLRVGLFGDGGSADDNAEQSWKVYCLDRETGRVLWERTAKTGLPRAARHTKATHANTTLATDGRRLLAFFGSEGLYAYDLTGKLLWQKDLGVLDMTPADDRTLSWGFASSPIVVGDKVIVQCDVKAGSFLAAFALADGKQLWKTDRSAVSLGSWGTPGVFGDLVVCNGYPFVAGYDLETGHERWRIAASGDVPVPVPFSANGLIYVAQAHGKGSPLIAFRPNGQVVWREERNGAYLSTPVAHQGQIYSVTSGGVFKSYDGLTGRKIYEERLGASAYTASPVAAAGRVYVTSEEGEVSVIEAGPTFRVLSKNLLGEITLATPALADGTIYFRTRREIIAIRD